MPMERVVIILTGLLGVLGVLMLLNTGSEKEYRYESAALYNDERAGGELGREAPELPSCATDILAIKDRGDIVSIAFTCADDAERRAFITDMRDTFLWDALVFDGGRVLLTGVEEE